MSTYSDVKDLLLGDVAPPSTDMTQKYVQDAADEIDSKLGMLYQTPIVVADPVANRATVLLLKRINNWLASGRIVLANSMSREEQYLNAYGKSLVSDAEMALNELASGLTPLPGATPLDPEADTSTGPVIGNLDPQSNVESFYTWASTPAYPYPYPGPPGVIYPGSGRTY